MWEGELERELGGQEGTPRSLLITTLSRPNQSPTEKEVHHSENSTVFFLSSLFPPSFSVHLPPSFHLYLLVSHYPRIGQEILTWDRIDMSLAISAKTSRNDQQHRHQPHLPNESAFPGPHTQAALAQ